LADSSSRTVVYAALAGNLLVAITKAGAAAWTGSSSMLSEAVHSLVGIVLAAAGTYASASLGLHVADGIASIAIGVVLAVVAVLLAGESKSLLIGERADRELSEAIVALAGQEQSVARVNGLLTVQLAPDQVLVGLSLEFADDLRTPQIEKAVTEIEARVKAAHPEVVTLFVKPQTEGTYRDIVRRLEEG
jgi:divalent metal cation (Fe/Co/Zn/Cd) transporter